LAGFGSFATDSFIVIRECRRCTLWAAIDWRQRVASVFEKLNLKDQKEILVVNAPASFEQEISRLDGVLVQRDPERMAAIRFALAFATQQQELDRLARLLVARAEGDALLWFAYPKGTSRNYRCDFNRDTGWDVLRASGFDSVRQIAIDEDWSALRFRRVEYMKPAARR
jgi:hypothetical protein